VNFPIIQFWATLHFFANGHLIQKLVDKLVQVRSTWMSVSITFPDPLFSFIVVAPTPSGKQTWPKWALLGKSSLNIHGRFSSKAHEKNY
jgi:hypothetical protein